MSSNYWSSTTNANNTDNAWAVNFNNGNVNNNNKDNNNYVRAVRSGKWRLLSFKSVHDAYMDCRRRKRGTINALRFEANLLENLFDLALELQNGSYRPARSVCFVTTRPKLREIFAADFRDRIVHHLLVRELEKIWEPLFIHDSYASRKGKGIHAAVERLTSFMHKATRSMKRPAWYLQLDIRSFFMSIDKRILFRIFQDRLSSMDVPEAPVLEWLLHTVIFHDCTRDYFFKGDPAILKQVPFHKSLFRCPKDKGLPIGNLTSQFFANVYLNELDQFVKRELGCRFYIRYVDDLVLLSGHKDELDLWHRRVEKFLEERLALSLKPGVRVRSISDGIDFLGYITRPRYRLARRRVVNNLKARLDLFKNGLVTWLSCGSGVVERCDMEPARIIALRQMLSSYLGHLRHANTRKLVKSLFERHGWLNHYFLFSGSRLTLRFHHKEAFRGFVSQVAFFRSRARGALLFVRVGSHYELYNEDAIFARDSFRLKVMEERRGMRCAAGFPARFLQSFIEKALYVQRDIVVVEQSEVPGARVMQRYVKRLYVWRQAEDKTKR